MLIALGQVSEKRFLLNRIKESFETSNPPGEEYGIDGNPNVYQLFVLALRIEWMRNGMKLSLAEFEKVIDGWEDELNDAIDVISRKISTTRPSSPHLLLGSKAANRPTKPLLVAPYSSAANLSLTHHELKVFVKTVSLAKACFDSDFMMRFVELLNDAALQTADSLALPFVFLCAPSGSGKSVFGTNIGSAFPSLHWLLDTSANMQACYLPFSSITVAMREALKNDLKRYKIFLG